MRDLSMPLWERYLMTIEEASMYFRIGENKLREVANEHKDVCMLQNGNRMLIKKKACPWDNACIESFHSLIKREWLNQYKIQNYDDAYKLIFEYYRDIL